MPPAADMTRTEDSTDAATEVTPLLAAAESGTPASYNGDNNGKATAEQNAGSPDDEEEPPMPVVQILLLCYASLAEPVAYFSIFPFVNEMIERTGSVPVSSVGFYAGLIESLFSLVQMILMILYGRMADRIGRKPVLVFSLAGVTVATAMFGLSRTLWQMIMFRCVAGLFAGSVVTVRTMLSENTTKLTQGKAFAWYSFARNIGLFIGPLVGGGLANPTKLYPGTFGGVQFFEDYPYFLATFVAGLVCLTSALSSLFFLNETLKTASASDDSKPAPPLTTTEVLNAPGVKMVLYIFAHVGVLALGYTALSPVYLYTPIHLGGLHFSPEQISWFIALAGFSQALWMLFAFPPLQRTLGTGKVLRICAGIWPFMMAVYPLLNEFARRGWFTAMWTVGAGNIILGSGVAMAFACVQLCLNDVSPSPTVLATVNAIALTVNCGVRAVAPALFTSLYAFGIKLGWADGHLAWFLVVAIALGLNVATRYLPEAAEGRPVVKVKHVDHANDE
ncbi:unnamed protein product [Zymoseptoria tritici ST99CH_3D1]|nr:unnamed protein product [Zymoseptoria tritici ST99CH_3D1]